MKPHDYVFIKNKFDRIKLRCPRRGGWPKGGLASTPRRPSALEHGSDGHETLPKRVSDDPRQFNFRRKKFFRARFFGLGNRFTPFWSSFGGSTEKRTSTANSSQFFALDAPILRPVRPKIVGNTSVGALGSQMYRSNPPCPQPPQCGQGSLRSSNSLLFPLLFPLL